MNASNRDNTEQHALLNKVTRLGQRRRRPGAQEIADLVAKVLRLGADAIRNDPEVGKVTAQLASLAGPVARTVTEKVVASLASFRFAPAAWEAPCEGLRPFQPAPLFVRDYARSYLEALAALERAVEAARSWREKGGAAEWVSDLENSLAEAHREALDVLAQSRVRPHLWPLSNEAARSGAGGVVFPLVHEIGLLAAPAGPQTLSTDTVASFGDAIRAVVARAPDLSGLASIEGQLAQDVMPLVVRGEIGVADLQAARKAVAGPDARWRIAHREAFARSGMRFSRSLERRFMELGRPKEGHEWVMASHALTLAGLKLEVFMDSRGLGCRLVDPSVGEPIASVRCNASGDAGHSLCAGLTDQPRTQDRPDGGRRRFRPGPLRPFLNRHGDLIDRAYSARAYLVNCGLSILRALFGWDLGRESVQRIHEAARPSVTDGDDLMAQVLAPDALTRLGWFRALPLAEGWQQRGFGTLGDLLDHWDRARPEDLKDEWHELGGELDTLAQVTGQLRPVDGDEFVLVSTYTATSVLSAQVVARFLAAAFPMSPRPRVVASKSAIQQKDLAQTRFVFAEQPIRSLCECLKEQYEAVLAEGMDAVLVVPGGTKWQTAAAMILAEGRGVPCVYKATDGRPVVIDFVRREPGRQAATVAVALPPGPESEPLPVIPGARWLLLSVGLSLERAWRSATRATEPPTANALVAWAMGLPEHQRATVCAEMTAFGTWRRKLLQKGHTGPLCVALISTDADNRSGPGGVCAGAVTQLLEAAGARVFRRPEWSVIDLKDAPEPDPQVPMGTHPVIFHGLIAPVVRCINEVHRAQGQKPDVIPLGGQKFTTSLLHVLAVFYGCEVYLTAESQGGEFSLWNASGRDEPSELPDEYDLSVTPA